MRGRHDNHQLAAIARPPARRRPERIGALRLGRAVGRLIADRRRLKHVPTVGQIKAMAWLDGREPVSYLLDRDQNFVPEPLDFGYERELGSHALCYPTSHGTTLAIPVRK